MFHTDSTEPERRPYDVAAARAFRDLGELPGDLSDLDVLDFTAIDVAIRTMTGQA